MKSTACARRLRGTNTVGRATAGIGKFTAGDAPRFRGDRRERREEIIEKNLIGFGSKKWAWINSSLF